MAIDLQILQQPDALSFSQNLKPLILEKDFDVKFTLIRDNVLVFEERCYPFNGSIEIDLREIVDNTLSVDIPTQDVYVQPNAVANYTYYVDDIPEGEFRVVKGGVNDINLSAVDFLRSNFLTWQPQVKAITYNQPEYLSYYFTESGVIKVKFYYTDGTSRVVDLFTGAAGQCVTCNLQMSVVWVNNSTENIREGYFDVWVESSSAVKMSYPQRYVYSPDKQIDFIYLAKNSLGGIDTYLFSGERSLARSFEYSVYYYARSLGSQLNSSSRVYSQNTGLLSRYYQDWLSDFFASKSAYILDGNSVRAIALNSSSITTSNVQMGLSADFSYQMADDSVLLNLYRDNDLPKGIKILAPDDEYYWPFIVQPGENFITADGDVFLVRK